uniref:PB1 domain-containing protein n=1 Tax=Ditylenchus dipsaci TaxID=166011 RepID=A0A915E081_9BILA
MLSGIIESPMVLKAKCGSEIKKLQLYQGQNWDFDELAKKLQRVFQISSHQLVALKYRDTDGDWVTVADDEDLGIAMRNEPSLFIDVLIDVDAEPLSPVVSNTKISSKDAEKQEPVTSAEQHPQSFSPLASYRQSVSSTFEPKQVPQEPQQLHYNGASSIQQQYAPPLVSYPAQQLQQSYQPPQAPPSTPSGYQQPPPQQNQQSYAPVQNAYQQQPFGMQPLQQELPPSVTGNAPGGNPFSRGQPMGFARPNNPRY